MDMESPTNTDLDIELADCPRCPDSRGVLYIADDTGLPVVYAHQTWTDVPCHVCNGIGFVPAEEN